MFILDANQIATDLRGVADKLRAFDRDAQDTATETARYAKNLVQSRIQLAGRNTAGDIMETESFPVVGRYSQQHGKKRLQRGLQTNTVDLTFSGELFNAWESEPTGDGQRPESVVGFTDDAMAERAEYVEAYFGTAFNLSAEEESEAGDYFTRVSQERMAYFLNQ